MNNADVKIFKGKVKYNFWISLCANMNRFMFGCFLIFMVCSGAIFFEEGVSSLIFLASFFVIFMTFCYFYGSWVMKIIQQWDKPGFDILTVNSRQKFFFLDHRKMVNFTDVKEIYFELCEDKLPSIPRMYDLVNAQMRLKLKNGEEIIYYIQMLNALYKLLSYLRGLGFNVQALPFENNILYKMAAHYWVVLFVVLAALVPLIIIFQ